jgi:hypothetical protein
MCVRVSTSRQPRQRVRSLYQRANGYSHPAVKIFMPAGAKKAVYAPRQPVERSLYTRAVGYNYEAVKIFMPTCSSC